MAGSPGPIRFEVRGAGYRSVPFILLLAGLRACHDGEFSGDPIIHKFFFAQGPIVRIGGAFIDDHVIE
jgi:hypothetical protein